MMQQNKRIIFHAPFVLGEHRASYAGGIRPQKMYHAFQEMGYEIYEVTGGVKQRKESIKNLKSLIRAGTKFDFLYSESTTKPQVFTGKYRYPFNPFFDYSFFRFCRRKGIPTSLFYRDVWWRFEEFRNQHGLLKTLFLTIFYLWDLVNYRSALSVLYLPSSGYEKYLPFTKKIAKIPLAPGAEITQFPLQLDDVLLYIGGLGGDHYRINAAFEGVIADEKSTLIVCTRESEWQAIKASYPQHESISVVHKSGPELHELYENSKYCLLFMVPTKYREFAVPFKLFEYLGAGKPIIASKGTFAARLVEDWNIGWAIDYSADALKQLLIRLRNNPSEYLAIYENVSRVRFEHTWQSRAKQVSIELENSLKKRPRSTNKQ